WRAEVRRIISLPLWRHWHPLLVVLAEDRGGPHNRSSGMGASLEPSRFPSRQGKSDGTSRALSTSTSSSLFPRISTTNSTRDFVDPDSLFTLPDAFCAFHF